MGYRPCCPDEMLEQSVPAILQRLKDERGRCLLVLIPT